MSTDASTAAPPMHTLESAFVHCEQLARSHYENFPVASRLLPRRLRRPIAVIYAFARGADDLADEGPLEPSQRLALLDAYGQRLSAIEQGEPADDPVFMALAAVTAEFRLPWPLFHDLLSAFRQDVTQKRYTSFAELADYCRRSANPVGRLLLHLNGDASPANLDGSDHICSALQLINFYQDLAQDYDENGRIYLPLDEMADCGVGDDHLRERRNDTALQTLLAMQYRRARQLMERGAPLGQRLHGRFGLEIRLIIQGGLRILDKLEANLQTAPFARPRLGLTDWPILLWRAL